MTRTVPVFAPVGPDRHGLTHRFGLTTLQDEFRRRVTVVIVSDEPTRPDPPFSHLRRGLLRERPISRDPEGVDRHPEVVGGPGRQPELDSSPTGPHGCRCSPLGLDVGPPHSRRLPAPATEPVPFMLEKCLNDGCVISLVTSPRDGHGTASQHGARALGQLRATAQRTMVSRG